MKITQISTIIMSCSIAQAAAKYVAPKDNPKCATCKCPSGEFTSTLNFCYSATNPGCPKECEGLQPCS